MLIAENDSIVIRSFENSDASEFCNAVLESLDTVGVWMPWCHDQYSETEALEWFDSCARGISSGESYDVGLFDKDDGLLLGSVAINQIDSVNRIGNIGYWIRRTQQQKGIAVSAVRMMHQFGLGELGLNRLIIVVVESNLASRRVAEKSGAHFECIAAKRLMHQGKPQAAAIYSFTDLE